MSNSSTRTPGMGFIFSSVTFAMVGVGLVIPVLPTLINEQFSGGNYEVGAKWFGLMVMVYSIMQFFFSPILGSLSDRVGRRKIILIATAGSAIDYVIMAQATSLEWFFISRAIAGATAGILATANAYIADVTPPEKRAQSFGMLGAAFGIGFIVGPVAGGFLGAYHIRWPFWFAAGCSAANFCYGFFVLPESLKAEHRRAFSWRRANPIGALVALQRFPAVLWLVVCFFLLTTAQIMLQVTWVLYTEYLYSWTTKEVGWSLGFVGIATAIVQAGFVRKIVPKLGDVRAVTLGFCISMVAQVGYGLAAHGWELYAVICVGCFAGIAGPALQSYVTKHVPANEQGAVQGVFAGIASLAAIPAPYIASRSFSLGISPKYALHLPGLSFFVGALITAVALALAIATFKHDTVAPKVASVPPAEA